MSGVSVDIRWVQRLDNLKKAFAEFSLGIDLSRTRSLSKLETQGLIQSFEYTHELAWKTLKGYGSLLKLGVQGTIQAPRPPGFRGR